MELPFKWDTIAGVIGNNAMYLPLYFKTDRLPCLVIGGGHVAARKVDMLLAAGCSLTLIAPDIVPSIRDAVARGWIEWQAREYAGGDLAGFRLVIAATPHEEINRAVSIEAGHRGIPVNVVDVPELCTVIFGAIWQEGPLTISVSTGGTAPFMAAAIRDRVSMVAGGMGYWVEAAARFRTAVRNSIHDPAEKKGLYRRFRDRISAGNPFGMPQTDDFPAWIAWLDQSDDPAD